LIVYFDIETNGFLDDATEVVCMSVAINDREPTIAHTKEQILEALDCLTDADVVVGHNIQAFDLPMLRKLYKRWKGPKGLVRDTLVMARLIYPDRRDLDIEDSSRVLPNDLIGSHSLKAWGYRLGMHKDEYIEGLQDYANLKYTPELGSYCQQDVRVTRALYQQLDKTWVSDCDALILEHDFAECIAAQVRNGFAFDGAKAATLYADLCQKRDALTDELQALVPPTEIVLKTKTKHVPFNPGSRQQIAKYLKSQGWEPELFNESGSPKVDEAVLSKIDHPVAAKLSEYLMLQKRIGMLAEGTESWMKVVKPNGRIHGSVNHNGAVTGRCTHRGPNMAQVPASKSPYGKECRSLFIAPPGKVLIGVDAAGLELRCLAHYLSRYDNGEFRRELLEGDIHTANQKAAELPTRDAAKVFIYAFLYGAGPDKLGKIVGGGYDEGKAMQKRFLNKVPALAMLKKQVEAAASLRGYLTGLDGRHLRIRSKHAALNTLLQSAGAVLMKQATILMNQRIRMAGLHALQVGHIHDEVQFECPEAEAEEVSKILEQCIKDAGEAFGFRCPLDGEARVGATWAETH
jgi:DNA polymerase-1